MSMTELNENEKIRDSWIWPDSVTEFAKKHMEGYTLNAPAGENELGDVRLDADPQEKNIKEGDIRDLPFDRNTFDTVIQDPPWKVGYSKRFKYFFEAVRVTKVGGKIIYNAYWLPKSKVTELKEEKVAIRQDAPFANTSVLAVFEKTSTINPNKKLTEIIDDSVEECNH